MSSNHDRDDTVQRLSRVDTGKLPADGGKQYNRLIFEKSPYLLQHAENPMDWYPWGEEAFTRARVEDKPVFLSIGYSTCHWCHVMEKESFESKQVAKFINRHFISIKVDREERPDIDSTYMNVCQIMTGSGGWPLNLVLTPEKKPFFAGTFIPREPRGGMIGLIQIMEKINDLWKTERDKLLHTGDELTVALNTMHNEPATKHPLKDSVLRKAFAEFHSSFDYRNAGFGHAPKFPTPHNLSLLLRLGRRFDEKQAQAMVLQTLQAMRLGGIYDQVGFGIHRYSVDDRWLVPHFEKMLYDQALTVLACLDAYQASADDFFAQTAREILSYVTRDLADPQGAFYCGEDADSEGAEGTFYLWTPREVEQALGADLAKVFCRSFDVTEGGNFEGKSIPHLKEDVAALAKRVKADEGELAELLEQARQKLFEVREQRVRPHRDDKVLTGWNGLAIAALARAGAILDDRKLLDQAETAARFIFNKLRAPNGRLLRRWRLGDASIPAFLEDYAYLTWGLIELYQAGFDSWALEEALTLSRQIEELFSDNQGGYFDTGSDAETILSRGRSMQDGALPSAHSVTACNLLRLGRITADSAMEERASNLIAARLDHLESYPQAFAQWLTALDLALGPAQEVVLAAEDKGTPPAELLQVVRRRFLPNTQLLWNRPGDKKLATLTPLTAGKTALKGNPAAYLCRNRSCQAPVTSAEELEKLLDKEPCG